MRSPVRKLIGVAVVGTLGALFAMPMLTAGAQTEPAPPGDCVILSVTPNPVPDFPAVVTVSGTAPNGVHLTLYAQAPLPNGPVVAVAEQDVTNGTWSLQVHVTEPTNVSANYTFGNKNAYTAGCATPSGDVVIHIDKAANAAKALAYTGSSNTPSFVLIGVAALVLGAVLIMAARRRSQVS